MQNKHDYVPHLEGNNKETEDLLMDIVHTIVTDDLDAVAYIKGYANGLKTAREAMHSPQDEEVSGCVKTVQDIDSELWPEWMQDIDGVWCLSVGDDGHAIAPTGCDFWYIRDTGWVRPSVVSASHTNLSRLSFPTLHDALLYVQQTYPNARGEQ